MLASAANGRFDRGLELGAEGAVPWAHPPSLPGSPPAVVGGCALAPPRGTAAEAATDTAIRLSVTYRHNDAWSFSLQGTNLADEEYRTTGYNLVTALGVLTGFYGPPRQYMLTARYDF